MISEKLAALWEETSPELKAYKDTVDSLKEPIGPSDAGDLPHKLHERLVLISNAMSAIGDIVDDLARVRSKLRMHVAEKQAAYDDAVIEVMKKTRIGEYTSAKERDMTYMAGAFSQLSELRKAQKMLSEIEEYYDYCHSKYRSLDNQRRDIDARTRLLNIEVNLSR